MSDIESKLARSLAARVSGPVQADDLAERAVARAKTLKTRRGVLAAAAVSLAVAAGSLGAWRLLPAPPHTTLPAALGVPSAASAPEQIGTDPALLHFDVDMEAFGSLRAGVPAEVEFTSVEGHETVALYGADHKAIAVVGIANSLSDLGVTANSWMDQHSVDVTVDGRPGRLTPPNAQDGTDRYSGVRWEARDGIFVMINAREQDAVGFAVKVFKTLRLTAPQRCATPMRLTALPPGARWTGCGIRARLAPAAGQSVFVSAGLTIRQPAGNSVGVSATELGAETNSTFEADRTVAGCPAQWLAKSPRGLWIPQFGRLDLFVYEDDSFHADLLTEQDATWLAEHVEAVEDLTDTDAWPTARPAG